MLVETSMSLKTKENAYAGSIEKRITGLLVTFRKTVVQYNVAQKLKSHVRSLK